MIKQSAIMGASRPALGASLALGAALLLSGCVSVAHSDRDVVAHANLIGADGTAKGHAAIVRVGERLDLQLDVTGLTPGVHGTHLHAKGACAPGDFASAGGHLNPDGKQHGTMNPQGSHLGDLPNLTIAPNGTGGLSFTLVGNAATLTPEILDADGAAIVVHAGPDDYKTDPSGASGARIACGVFEPGA